MEPTIRIRNSLIALALTLAAAADAEAAQATLRWTINAPAATETAIERRQESPTATPYAEIAAPKTPTNQYIDATLTTGAIYCWKLRSRNAETTSLPTPEVCLLATPGGVTIIYTP